ncbi:hypothetical protein PFISCL1PPCAC_26242, partial [Pristionchus fissidentatus]
QIEAHHFNHLMDLSRGFFEDENLTKATGSTIDNCQKGMEFVLSYAIAAQSVYPRAWICYENSTNRPVGFRLAHPVYKDPKKAPFSVPEPTLNNQELTLFTKLDKTFNKFWEVYPEEEIVYKGEVIYINRDYRGSGIYKTIMNYDVYFPDVAKVGAA